MRFNASNNPQNHIYTKIAKLHIRLFVKSATNYRGM